MIQHRSNDSRKRLGQQEQHRSAGLPQLCDRRTAGADSGDAGGGGHLCLLLAEHGQLHQPTQSSQQIYKVEIRQDYGEERDIILILITYFLIRCLWYSNQPLY